MLEPDWARRLRRLDVEVRLINALVEVTRAELFVFRSAEGYEAEVGFIATELRGGPRAWETSLVLTPGTYYIRPCFHGRCGEYVTLRGDPQPVGVEAGEITSIEVVF